MAKSATRKIECFDKPDPVSSLDETTPLPALSLPDYDAAIDAKITDFSAHLISEQLKHLIKLAEDMNRNLEQIAASVKKPAVSRKRKPAKKKTAKS